MRGWTPSPGDTLSTCHIGIACALYLSTGGRRPLSSLPHMPLLGWTNVTWWSSVPRRQAMVSCAWVSTLAQVRWVGPQALGLNLNGVLLRIEAMVSSAAQTPGETQRDCQCVPAVNAEPIRPTEETEPGREWVEWVCPGVEPTEKWHPSFWWSPCSLVSPRVPVYWEGAQSSHSTPPFTWLSIASNL